VGGQLAVLWPDEGNYARFVEISEGQFAPTVEGYKATAEATLKYAERKGVTVHRVPFDPEELAQWAHRAGRAVDAEARTTFAVMLARKANRP